MSRHDDNDNDDNHDDCCCPVCLCSPSDDDDDDDMRNMAMMTIMLSTPCGHVVCQRCMERILLTKTSSAATSIAAPATRGALRTTSSSMNDVVTRGSCPICRCDLSLFDLTVVVGKDQDGSENGGGGDDGGATPAPLAYPRDTNIRDSPIGGLVYVLNTATTRTVDDDDDHDDARPPLDGTIASFHFDAVVPYVKVQGQQNGGSIIGSHPHTSTDEDDPSGNIMIQFDSFHWHDVTRTFHGRLLVANEQEEWKVILQFSHDGRFVCHGVISKQWRIMVEQQQQQCECCFALYPLDGLWTVEWEATGYRDAIRVVRNQFKYGHHLYTLDLSNPGQPKFEWPIAGALTSWSAATPRRVLQTAVAGAADLTKEPRGPNVGARVAWNTTHGECIVWTRETRGDDVRVERLGPSATANGGAGDIRMYRRLDATPSPSSRRPTYHADTLWGNAFCQGLRVGFASYHFVFPNNDGTAISTADSQPRSAYISYEHPMCTRWPPLDNGSPVPSQVYFQNVSFDESQRVFRGTIEWQEEYGTTWQGCSKWIYEMKFDSEYTCIVSGGVKSVMYGNNDDEQDMSTFGDDLVYINAAVMDKYVALMATEAEDAPGNTDMDYHRFRLIAQSQQARLADEGASVRTHAIMHHVLTASLQSDSNPIDFNL